MKLAWNRRPQSTRQSSAAAIRPGLAGFLAVSRSFSASDGASQAYFEGQKARHALILRRPFHRASTYRSLRRVVWELQLIEPPGTSNIFERSALRSLVPNYVFCHCLASAAYKCTLIPWEGPWQRCCVRFSWLHLAPFLRWAVWRIPHMLMSVCKQSGLSRFACQFEESGSPPHACGLEKLTYACARTLAKARTHAP